MFPSNDASESSYSNLSQTPCSHLLLTNVSTGEVKTRPERSMNQKRLFTLNILLKFLISGQIRDMSKRYF